MAKRLRLADGLNLPLEVVTQKLGWIGTTGSGKTYGATKLAELMYDAGAQFVALDPVGVWYGLRLAANGKKPSDVTIPIFGGLHGDVPLEAGAGAMMADLVVDRALTCILDVSQFESDAQKARFAEAFADRFFFRKKASPSAVHLFIEECLPPDTDVLTAYGWKSIADVEVGDWVVCFNQQYGSYQSETVHRTIRKPFNGELVHFQTTSLDCAVTPGHRVILRRFQHDPKRYRLYPWTECEAVRAPRDFQIPSGGAPNGTGVDIPDDLLRVIGWLITDGYLNGKSLGLSAASTTVKLGRHIAAEMRAVLSRLGVKSAYERKARATRGPNGPLHGAASVEFYFGVKLTSAILEILGGQIHRIPRRLLSNCSYRQLRILYDGLLEGDGTAKNGRWSRFYAGLNEALADDFQELATRLGIRTLKKRVPQNGEWIVALSETVNHWVRNQKRTIRYKGDVYCITVPTGAFVARRNGTVFVTGNCQEFVPEHQQRGEERMLHAFTRLQKIGRNFGIGTSLITQRPQEVAKKALNLAQTLFVFRTTGSHERGAIERWIKDKAIEGQDISSDLPKLKTGAPHVWSPEWLQRSEVVRILEKRTFNASATPEVGAAAVTRELAPIDLAKIRAQMSATIEKAKADDPRELRKRIKQLEDQVAGKALTAVAVHLEKQKPALTDADRKLLEKLGDKIAEAVSLHHEDLVLAGKRFDHALQLVSGEYAGKVTETTSLAQGRMQALFEAVSIQKLIGKLSQIQPPTTNAVPRSSQTRRVDRALPPSTRSTPARLVSSGDSSLGKGERIILTAAAQHRDGVTREQLTVLTGYKKSSRDVYLQRLGQAGLAGVSHGGLIRPTAEGLKALGDFTPLPTGAALLEYWLRELPEGERRILELVAAHHPGQVSRDTISEATGYKKSSRDVYLQRLSARRLVDTDRGSVRASSELFD